MRSPRTAPAVGIVVLLVLSGCTGTLLDVSASPATVPESALATVGYEHVDTTAVPLTYPIAVGPVVRDVRVTSYLSGYDRTTAENRTATLLVLSTPNVEVGGESINPFAHLSNRELAVRVLDETRRLSTVGAVGSLSEVRLVDANERIVLGTRTEVLTYAAILESEGESRAVLLHVVAVPHGRDVVVAVGLHEVTLDESAALESLIEQIEHDDR